MKDAFPSLPKHIKVSVIKNKKGSYIATIPAYDIFTEADTFEELQFMINDLILTYFDVPKKLHNKIWYKSTEAKNSLIQVSQTTPFNILISPELTDYIHA